MTHVFGSTSTIVERRHSREYRVETQEEIQRLLERVFLVEDNLTHGPFGELHLLTGQDGSEQRN